MSSAKHVESRDIMPCGHSSKGISCDHYESDRKEYGGDVMVLRNKLRGDHLNTQGKNEKTSLMIGIVHEDLQFVKPGQPVDQKKEDFTTQRHSDKELLMTANEEDLGLKPNQIAGQDIDSKPYVKECKMMVNQHGCSKDKTETQSGQQNKDIKRVKRQTERKKNNTSLHISNSKKQTKSVEHEKDIISVKKHMERKKNGTSLHASNDKKQTKSFEHEKDIKHHQNQYKMMIKQHGCSKDKTETQWGQQNKDVKSVKRQTKRKKNDTSLHVSNDKKQTELVEHEKDMKHGKQIFEKRDKATTHQISKEKKQTGSVGQNREKRCRKRPGEKKKKHDKAHHNSIHKEQTGSNKYNKAEKKNLQKKAIQYDKILWVFHTYMYLCYMMVLLVVDSYKSTKSGSWVLNNTHVVLGESVVLRCTFDTNICKTGSTRRWTKGKFQTFLTTNGKSVKESKYKEVISSDCFTSFLIITDFNQDDMGVEYTFAYSTMEISSELKLERSGYISYPKNETTTGKISCTKRNVSLNLKLFDINPVPNCSMVIKNETICTERQTKNTSEFLSNSEYLFQYKLKQNHKQGMLYVWCNFETRNITVFDGWFNCDDPQDLEKEDDHTVMIAASLVVLFVIFVIVLVFWQYDKWKKKKKKTKEEYRQVGNGDVGNNK